MLHEARDRKKFVSDVQYLRDMQHKVDSEYQACLRRQEFRRDPNDKKQYQYWEQEASFERSRFSSTSSSKQVRGPSSGQTRAQGPLPAFLEQASRGHLLGQASSASFLLRFCAEFQQSSGEEEPVTEPKSSPKIPTAKCDSKLPAIDQTSVKQKHKSTMTPRRPEKTGPSKPPAAQTPKILPRRRRPNLGRLAVSPELHSPRAPGDRSRQKAQLPGKTPLLLGPDPAAHRESHVWAAETKLRRPAPERGSLVSASQLVTTAENLPERSRRGDGSALPQSTPQPVLSQARQAASSPRGLGESLGPSWVPTTMGGPRRTPFRFRDENFYSTLSLTAREHYDTEEETHAEEERLLLGVRPPRSPAHSKRSRFSGTSASQARNQHFKHAATCKDSSSRPPEPSPGSPRVSSGMEPETEQPAVGQRMLRDARLPDEENGSAGSEGEKRASSSPGNMSDPRRKDGLKVENGTSGFISTQDEPDTHDYERDWQGCPDGSRTSPACCLSGEPTAPWSSPSSSYNTPGTAWHRLRGDMPAGSSASPPAAHDSDLEGNARLTIHQPLSPIRNRIPIVSAEDHSDLSVSNTREPGGRETRGARGVPLYPENALLSPRGSLSSLDSPSSSSSRMSSQGHVRMPGAVPGNIHLTLSAVSHFLNHNGNGPVMAASGLTGANETPKVQVDPEKIKKLQESLLEEDSEEEGDLCRICQMAGSCSTNPLLQPCGCVGSLRFVHQECLKKWLKVKITSGANREAVNTCEMCKQDLLVDLAVFNMTEFYQKHQQIRAQNELINSSLYLVLLLHFYEQRFAEIMRLNYNWIIRERLSRNYLQPRQEEDENSELEEESEGSVSPGRTV
ncbi:probable E3 ubiquitin-protein ligase MARCHF10 isoform X2 [Ochotona princeps]|uniref:probable E3 ubiquitin-protein ligase MARCHF10 isoform X2 n=1 Tax=Ochotona princeps TaxID=9978 RepID=UPI0027155D1B|nr:probable E3 ubiquitin-protein ligase MARCHF10 isoform X2 [Ochotona princeps]